MENTYIWKNYSLGRELNVAGSFIFNGLKSFDSMKNFGYEDEVFEFLYNISVGIERLGKIAVILIEHDDVKDQEEFEKSLITHNHLSLVQRISKKYNCGFSNIHNEFLQLLNDFYKSMRYDRFTMNNIWSHDKERVSLVEFLEKHLKTKIEYKDVFITSNEWRYKKFVGKVVGKISEEFYKIIKKEATSQNMYTYELRYSSKASKIFLGKKYDFFDDNIVWKEILVYLMNTNDNNRILDFIRKIEPLDFDPALVNDYIDAFNSDIKRYKLIYEIEEYYQEIHEKKQRIEMLEILGNPYVYFDYDNEEYENDYNNE